MTLQDCTIPMPITQETQQIALQFASEQPTQEKALQVYLNTLAVCSVNNYLRIVDIPTNLIGSDSWNPAVRLAEDVADLWVNGIGRLECRPLQVTQQSTNNLPWQFLRPKPVPHSCPIPPGIQEERIGYIVVQINIEQQEATLLGFSPTASTELLLSQLQPINTLLKYLEQQSTLPTVPVNLSQWLQNVFAVGWQSVEAFLDSQIADSTTSKFAFRRSATNCIRRAKLLHLGKQQPRLNVVLVVTLTQQQSTHFGIDLQVIPQGRAAYLPMGLKFAVLDEAEAPFFEIELENNQPLIQIRQFSGQVGETFCVKFSVGEDTVVEYFII